VGGGGGNQEEERGNRGEKMKGERSGEKGRGRASKRVIQKVKHATNQISFRENTKEREIAYVRQ
jgi:hypothetical protein